MRLTMSADFHPDQFYQVHSSTEEGIACHRKKGLAGTYGAEVTDCDSPFSLVNATFDWIQDNIKDDIDFVVWTGDSARHDSDEKHPRSADQVLSTNIMMADKFVETFSGKHGRLDVPVIPTWGNNDFLPHNIFFPGPNKWLRKYSEIWQRFIPEEQRHSFQFGGWFYVEVIPNQLAVFSLNTLYFFDRNAGVDGCAEPSEPGFKHMEWLRIQLQILRERGMKAILIGHVPPARTSSKQNWDETCWQKYTLWLQQYRDVVTGSLYGHMNIDHFLLQDTKEIDIAAQGSSYGTRDSMEDEISISSKQDYLQDLRKGWSDLPGSAIKALQEEEVENNDVNAEGKKKKKKKKKDKYKKLGGKYAERYLLSLVSPSIVPNYFPTLRIIEYNITGLEDSKVWADSFDVSKAIDPAANIWDDTEEEALASIESDLEAERKEKKKKKKHKKPKKPKDPKLVVPKDPPEGATPGPAYFPQPMTFTGYTQYFANLTYINNDLTEDVEGDRWRDGDYADEEPKHKHPQPREFKFEVEYSTFDDKYYKLRDMTVMEYVKLAYRLSRKKIKGKAIDAGDFDFEVDEDASGSDSEDGEDPGLELRDEGEVDEDSEDEEVQNEDLADGEARAEKKKGKKHKKKKKKKHHKNKAWKEFLDRAFVSTLSEEDLDKMT